MSRRGNTATRRKRAQRPTLQPTAKITPLYGSANYSGTYDMTAEVLTEASLAKQNRSLSLDWDETEGMNIPSSMRSSSGLSEQDRKETLLTAYIQNSWISACVDVIAKRITSGGFAIEPMTQGQEEDADRKILFNFCSLINEDWDFLQFIRSVITDLLIFGESYVEIVWQGKRPVQLHKIDCMTMSYSLARNGRITGYTQNVSHQQDPIPFGPDEIIRWWFPHPRASMKAMSPIERILNPTASDQKMVDWTQTFFRKGSKPPYWIETQGTEEEARRFVKYMKENYQGVKNANAPIVTYGGAQLHEYNKSIIDIDFATGRKTAREEILSVFGVPPALIGIIESGNIGGGTGESQDKALQYNTCDPIRQLIFEKLNYRITKKGFGITNWKINTRYGDYRSDDLISNIHDKGIRNGSVTINEVRAETGKTPIEGGDEAVIVTTKEIQPVQRLQELADEMREQTQTAMQQAQAQLDMTKAQVDKLKNPPAPPPVVVQPQQQPMPPEQAHNAPQGQDGGKPAQDEKQERYIRNAQQSLVKSTERQEHHTGMMLAFMLDPEISAQLALPGGEEPDDMHVTLAYLGDMQDEPPVGMMFPSQDLDRIKALLTSFAMIHNPLQGNVGGLARFTPSPSSDGMAPIIALVNVPGLQDFRRDLVSIIEGAGFFVANNFDYTPHATLQYVDAESPMPIEQVPALPLSLHTICLAIGDDHYYFPLSPGNPDETEPVEHVTQKNQSDFFESGRQWRPPSQAQLSLEDDLKRAVKAYISKAHISKDGVTLPDETVHDQLLDVLQNTLTQSVRIGRQTVSGTQQESLVSVVKDVAGRASQVIGDIITQLKDNAQRIIDNLFGGDEIPDDAQDELESQFEQWADGYADMVGQTEIHGAVEAAVLDEMQSIGVLKKRWIADPDACPMCVELASQPPVEVGEDFEGGLDGPPGHPRCRCVVGIANE